MRSKKLLATFLLGVGLCFVPVLGYGEVQQWMNETKETTYMELYLLQAPVQYIMQNPTSFLNINVFYDPTGDYRKTAGFPQDFDTKAKIVVVVKDNRAGFSGKPGTALIEQFEKELEAIYDSINVVATNMDTDIVAEFQSKEGVVLGYFYQGEYYLVENGELYRQKLG